MSEIFTFPGCGCQIEQVGMDGNMPKLKWSPEIENIPLDCSRTWDLISEGNTKGVFQLESRLGSMLAKKLKPRNIEHLAALVSIIRPGCLESMRDKKSVTQHYIDRKNGIEPIDYFHPALKPALEQTYGELVYQEQAMQIAKDIAGFDLQQADVLRKAIGKKKADIMAKVKIEFLDGTIKQKIVTQEEAEEIFSWIEKSQRYSFNKSHAVSYAINGYLSAYVKAHFKKMFFTSYLYFAQEKSNPREEINELVNNAKLNDVEVVTPSLKYMNEHFRLLDNKIRFGFADIKSVGAAIIIKLVAIIEEVETSLGKKVEDWGWVDFLVFVSPHVNKTATNNIISSGALDYMGESRTRMMFEFHMYTSLTKKEKSWIADKVANQKISFTNILQIMCKAPTGRKGACANKNRKEKVEDMLTLICNTPHSLKDSPIWIACQEEDLLGISLTYSIVDGCGGADNANCTCKEFIQGFNSKIIILAVKIDNANEIRTKKGKNPGQRMSFITASDNSAQLDSIVAFPNEWKEYKSLLMAEGNTVLLVGQKGKDSSSFIIQKVFQI